MTHQTDADRDREASSSFTSLILVQPTSPYCAVPMPTSSVETVRIEDK
jgi:hypothetical protein